MSRKSKQILGIFQKNGSNPNTDHNHLVFRGTLIVFILITAVAKSFNRKRSLQVSVVYDDHIAMNHLNELHPMGEGKMAFETAAGQVFFRSQ